MRELVLYRENLFTFAEFFFPVGRRIIPILETFHTTFTENRIEYKFFKGYDRWLNYTLADRNSGLKWMVELFHEIKNKGEKSRRKNEYLLAIYSVNSTLKTNDERGKHFIIEDDEIALFIKYYGKNRFRVESFSVIFFMYTDSLNYLHNNQNTLRSGLNKIVKIVKSAWLKTRPTLCRVDYSPDILFRGDRKIFRGKVPFAIYSICHPELLSQSAIKEISRDYLFEVLSDGAIFIENLKRKNKW